jgi:hypothetical protein
MPATFRLLLFGLVATTGLACAPKPDPRTALCESVLARRLPRARVVDTRVDRGASRVTLAFESARGVTVPTAGRLECETMASDAGGLRLRSARLDGAPLPEAEMAVINADLLLADLRQADPGPVAAARAGSR